MTYDPDFEPAPRDFRALFTGQTLSHLDEFVLSWQSGGHPLLYTPEIAEFRVNLCSGPALLFALHAPSNEMPAGIMMEIPQSVQAGIPADLVKRLWDELAYIGKVVENDHVPLFVSLGKFSRGDRKVFLAYALTIARQIACPP